MADILLVEDDATLVLSLEMTLQAHGHHVIVCRRLAEARDILKGGLPDLLLLDLGLPDGDGLDLCQELRQQGAITPILMLTARGTLGARVDGLRAGADDYLPKPFDLPELMARVEALLRRRRWHQGGGDLHIGKLHVDLSQRRALSDEEAVHLTDLEWRLLTYLVERRGEVISRDELLRRVWQSSPESQTRTVDVFISRLRRWMEEDSAKPRYLISVRGVGYCLNQD
ncbi:MAG: response regulator transcription factor [Myxococcota bacterium]|nr:DNA-binding response regulator [Myxococcales bacterium]MEC7750106.1 response regulator transcription factor [Myxococcota bacterium]